MPGPWKNGSRLSPGMRIFWSNISSEQNRASLTMTVGSEGDSTMPRFSANLGFLFPELPFLERFDAAARAGFTAVEYASPYEYKTAELRSRLNDAGLSQVLINSPAGNRAAGERGFACVPGREADFRDGAEQALDYAVALGCPCIDRKSTRLNSSHSQISYA